MVEIYPDPIALATAAAQRFVALAAAAIAVRGRFTVALAGGSTPAGLYRLLAEPAWATQVDWGRILVFFGDERCVSPEHPWSNYRMARETLLDAVPLPPANVYRVAGESEPAAAAAAYAAALRRAFGLRGAGRPVFDLILLGMGDDGHTASLFPGMPALDERRQIVVASAVPGYVQPAVSRVTLTFPVLNAARHVIFLVAGASKAEKVRAVLGDLRTASMPCQGTITNEDVAEHPFGLSLRTKPERSGAETSASSVEPSKHVLSEVEGGAERSSRQDRILRRSSGCSPVFGLSHPERSTAESKDLPAGRVQPTHGTLTWLLDRAAAGSPKSSLQAVCCSSRTTG